MTTITYQSILNNHLVDIATNISNPNWILMQDGVSCHTAASTKTWLNGQNINILNWTPYSPDMNIMEKIWGILVKKVYINGNGFENLKIDLEKAIQKAQSEISQNEIFKLFESLPHRVGDLISAKGGHTDY